MAQGSAGSYGSLTRSHPQGIHRWGQDRSWTRPSTIGGPRELASNAHENNAASCMKGGVRSPSTGRLQKDLT